MQQTPALAYWMAAFLVMPITAILRHTGCFHKEKGPHAEPRHTNGEKREHMRTAILARLDGQADPEGLLTLLSVLPLNTYTLEVERGTVPSGRRRIFCPSYRTLSDYLHRLVLGVQ